MNKSILKSADLKQTKKRELIIAILESSKKPLTAEEIYELSSKEMKMSFSTIYRALNALSDKGIITKTVHQDGKMYYKIHSHSHEHILKCIKCEEKISIDTCPLESLESNICKDTGYSITGHNLEFFGVCPKCKNKE